MTNDTMNLRTLVEKTLTPISTEFQEFYFQSIIGATASWRRVKGCFMNMTRSG